MYGSLIKCKPAKTINHQFLILFRQRSCPYGTKEQYVKMSQLEKENTPNNNDEKLRLDILIRSRDVRVVAVPFLHTVLEKNEHEFDKPQTKKQRVKQKELLAKAKRTVDDIQKDFDKVTHLAARQSHLPETQFIASRKKNDDEKLAAASTPPSQSAILKMLQTIMYSAWDLDYHVNLVIVRRRENVMTFRA